MVTPQAGAINVLGVYILPRPWPEQPKWLPQPWGGVQALARVIMSQVTFLDVHVGVNWYYLLRVSMLV